MKLLVNTALLLGYVIVAWAVGLFLLVLRSQFVPRVRPRTPLAKQAEERRKDAVASAYVAFYAVKTQNQQATTSLDRTLTWLRNRDNVGVLGLIASVIGIVVTLLLAILQS